MVQAQSQVTLERDGVLKVERKGYALLLTLNRPERLNAVSLEMKESLEEVIKASAVDPTVRVLIITGAGRAFCSGADVEAQRDGANQSFDERMARRRHWTPRQCKVYKPTICAVNGMCASAGLHFVADCDIVIASEEARFTDTHVNVGQITVQEPIGLLRRMALGPVLRLAMLGKAERLTAQQALELQMVSEVVPPDRLVPRALELAEILANVSPATVQKSLQLIWESLDHFQQAQDNAYETIMQHREHPDAKEGPRAFMEKRQPKWSDQ